MIPTLACWGVPGAVRGGRRLLPNRISGFTTVELLTSIGIVVALAALIFPAFARARTGAQAATCLSNLRQVGLALRGYQQDWDDRYPWAVDPIDKCLPGIWAGYPEFMEQVAGMPLLQDVLLPYTRSTALFSCPLDGGYDVADWVGRRLEAQPTSFARFGTSYSYRTDLTRVQMLDAALRAPVELMVLIDANGAWHGSSEVPDWRYNALHADGHARSLPRDQVQWQWDLPL